MPYEVVHDPRSVSNLVPHRHLRSIRITTIAVAAMERLRAGKLEVYALQDLLGSRWILRRLLSERPGPAGGRPPVVGPTSGMRSTIRGYTFAGRGVKE